jgi:cytochrome P450
MGDYFIPAGRLVCASPWVVGNDPDLVEKPEEVRKFSNYLLISDKC